MCEGFERGWAPEFLNYAEVVPEDIDVGGAHLRDVKAYVVAGVDDGVELSLQRRGVGKIENISVPPRSGFSKQCQGIPTV